MRSPVELRLPGIELVLRVDDHRPTLGPAEELAHARADAVLVLGTVGGNSDAREVADPVEHLVDVRVVAVGATGEAIQLAPEALRGLGSRGDLGADSIALDDTGLAYVGHAPRELYVAVSLAFVTRSRTFDDFR
jgi:hypothetical protein